MSVDYERPAKKRRFFSDNDSELIRARSTEPSDGENGPPETLRPQHSEAVQDDETNSSTLDGQLLETFVGEKLPAETLERLQALAGGDAQRAINIFLDGSWKETPQPRFPPSSGPIPAASVPTPALPLPTHIGRTKRTAVPALRRRYIGAFGVVGWATRSGTHILKHGDVVRIERAQMQQRTLKTSSQKREDNIVRFANTQGEEIGRLETDSSRWVAPLIDQKICELEGIVVFAPDRIKTNETIYLQLRAYFLKDVFESGKSIQLSETNRQTGLFEEKETREERNLRLRQLAIVKLFNEINLQPSQCSEAVEKHKRESLLKAAEDAEKAAEQRALTSTTSKVAETGGDTPGSEPEEGEELEQDQLDALYKKAQSFDFDTPEYEPATTFAMTLRKYQKQALYWMIGKEREIKAEHKERSMHPLWEEYKWPKKDANDVELPYVEGQESFYANPYSGELSLDFPLQEQNCLGGILADEMGLGKTIQMLALIHSNKPDVGVDTSPNGLHLPRLKIDNKAIEAAPHTTLVVAPMSLLAQWQSEAERASHNGTLRVLVYYGGDKTANLQNLCSRTNVRAPHVIITSYGTILSEFQQIGNSGGNRRSHGGLFSVEYLRVILDEGHTIKNRQSKTAKACYEISAKHRWVLTGTPIVNRLEDLFSLVHFLRVEPWSNFSYWKTFITEPFNTKPIKALDVVQTVLEPLVLRRTKDMKTPDGEALVPLPPKTIDIEKVILSKDERAVYHHIFTKAKRTFAANVEAGTLTKSYTTIFAQILRLRQSCCHPVLVRNQAVVADDEEAAAAADIASGLADDMDLASLIERFQVEEGEQDANKFGAYALQQIQDEAENECPICAEEPMVNQAVTSCWHSACKKCLLEYVEHEKANGRLPKCFHCREIINEGEIFEVMRHKDDENSQLSDNDIYDTPVTHDGTSAQRVSLRRLSRLSSAKINSVMSHLTLLRKTHPHMRSVVFSQFTSFMDLIEPELKRERIPFVRLDGSISQKQRATILSTFADMSPQAMKKNKGLVLLLSLKAGGVGLNLTSAERVFMMDPWWSFAVEAQAIDRVHRMGQEKEVKIVRFICEDSIEEKMLKVQERKKFIASSLGMMSDEERKMQRLEDIKELLS